MVEVLLAKPRLVVAVASPPWQQAAGRLESGPGRRVTVRTAPVRPESHRQVRMGYLEVAGWPREEELKPLVVGQAVEQPVPERTDSMEAAQLAVL